MELSRTYLLTELITWALEERFIDDFHEEGGGVVIVLGDQEFRLSHGRAHAFLRGIIQGMSRHRRYINYVEQIRRGRQLRPEESAMTAARAAVDEARRDFLGARWSQYRRAGYPLGRTYLGLTIWIRYETEATVN